MKTRIEHDSMGDIEVSTEALWGAQTQRSLQHFAIGEQRIPLPIIYALTHLKLACAKVNYKHQLLSEEKFEAIAQASDAILTGKLDGHFPLSVWQTGSGTQSNMNVNEVITNYANQKASKPLLHPNDDVNKGQSSNDTFPTALHIAAVTSIQSTLLPEIEEMIQTLQRLEKENAHIIKIGRTHLQDATPIRFSDEISGWRGMLENSLDMLQKAMDSLYKLAIGGTAVGTGLNTFKGFGDEVCQYLNEQLNLPFYSHPNKFHALSARDDISFAHGALKALAANCMKMANDIRWLASGPRCGLQEIFIPENEPGSSIMPGKVNPTQCEALTMIALQVIGNDATIGIAASQGNFELNVYLPLMAYNFLQSTTLLADGLRSFRLHCVNGIRANQQQMKAYSEQSLMVVTALNPIIGYEHAANTAKKAFQENITLKQACVDLGYLKEEEFDTFVVLEQMV